MLIHGRCLLWRIGIAIKVVNRSCPNSSFDAEVIETYVVGDINDERYAILRGLVINGPWQGKDKWTPETQGYGKKLPKAKTMNNKDIDWDVPEITSAVSEWIKEISEFAVSDIAITDKEVTFKDNALREYLNLMRPNLTKIGCAEVLCNDNGMNKYRAFCLTDKPPLKPNEVVYEAGKGGCKHGENCPQETCDKFGMCDVKP
ncbi:hypothetical protein Y032_0045g1136 [Ancylostoma ceylanicum]|uniref:SCP domain-containing protein n=1 Tax=Ancylostoma ceylanicum TaxID=53326 RepID=A0A016UE35_9BILA|nr:hypothetical protein Y032_0045g1136 [Ancylostoma ceylanicum]